MQFLMNMDFYLILLTFILGGCGIIVALNWKKSQLIALRMCNSAHNLYLNYKYRNYRCQITDKKYYVSKIIFATIGQPNKTKMMTNSDKISIDLRNNKLQIKCINLCQSEVNYQFTDKTIVFIHYVYDDDEYILPYKFKMTGVINLPFYEPNDIDTCMKTEYDTAETTHYNSTNSDIMETINKYAGPKGNFHNDLHYYYEPYLIYHFKAHDGRIEGHPLLMENDYLKLTTLTGKDMTFTNDQKIMINDSIF